MFRLALTIAIMLTSCVGFRGEHLFVQETARVEEDGGGGTVIRLYHMLGGFVGSAVVIAHEGGHTYLLTARHVVWVEDGFSPVVGSNFGPFQVEVVHEEADVAIISIAGTFGRPWSLGDDPDFGDEVRAWGYFQGYPTLTGGIVANPRLGWVDMTFGPGMSGGAVSCEGKLVGIISATYGHSLGGQEPVDIGVMVTLGPIRELMSEVGIDA